MQNSYDISLVNPIETTFDKALMGSSVNSTNIDLTGGSGAINYWMRLQSGDGSDDDLNSRTISIRHDRFDPSSYYYPEVRSGVKDLRQNCWYPSICHDSTGAIPRSCVSDTDLSEACQTDGVHCEG